MSVRRARPRAGHLIPLRDDLRLMPTSANRDGSPAWVIQDPVGNRFFRVGWLEFEILRRWRLGDPASIARSINRQTSLQVDEQSVRRVGEFFREQQLVQVRDAGGVRYLGAIAARARMAHWRWLLHNYLFIRIPLVRPQRLLQWLAPWCAGFYTPAFSTLTILAAVFGLVLAARQWDAFSHTFTDFLSPAGLAGYLVALFAAKTLHELGHAITATRLGVRVAHMGVAFLVLWPMLYTDTGESWKLARRSDRFRIAVAGMATELSLAAFATLAWSLAPDGAVRSALFFLATTSWVITLGINASPFMRFDGYFLLSDALDLPNLHERSFALARVALRRALFGWRDADPEPFEPGLRRLLIGFAWLTALYRLVVFFGIALAVYVLFFKVLGIILFVVEIVWFILRPIWNEMRIWIIRFGETGLGRRIALSMGLLMLFGALALPWQTAVTGPAWIHAAQTQVIYSPFPARLIRLAPNGPVLAGQVLAELDSPDIRNRAEQIRLASVALRRQADQSVGRVDGPLQRNLIIEQLGRELAALDVEQGELDRLRLVAPYGGRIVDREPGVKSGTWVSANQSLGILVDPGVWLIDALIAQDDVSRVVVGAPVRFYRRNDPGVPLIGEVQSVDTVRIQSLPDPVFDAQVGGPVATVRLTDGRIAPRDPLYRVRIGLPSVPEDLPERIALGDVTIEGAARSPLMHWLVTAASVLVRESGF